LADRVPVNPRDARWLHRWLHADATGRTLVQHVIAFKKLSSFASERVTGSSFPDFRFDN
jgi:hypothetical protein